MRTVSLSETCASVWEVGHFEIWCVCMRRVSLCEICGSVGNFRVCKICRSETGGSMWGMCERDVWVCVTSVSVRICVGHVFVRCAGLCDTCGSVRLVDLCAICGCLWDVWDFVKLVGLCEICGSVFARFVSLCGSLRFLSLWGFVRHVGMTYGHLWDGDTVCATWWVRWWGY